MTKCLVCELTKVHETQLGYINSINGHPHTRADMKARFPLAV